MATDTADKTQQGTINVSTENIFPIIKKFLYSDHEIFLRELVSNATDATQKLRTLSGMALASASAAAFASTTPAAAPTAADAAADNSSLVACMQ